MPYPVAGIRFDLELGVVEMGDRVRAIMWSPLVRGTIIVAAWVAASVVAMAVLRGYLWALWRLGETVGWAA